eukprot:2114606-Prymnesium_polylepis.1
MNLTLRTSGAFVVAFRRAGHRWLRRPAVSECVEAPDQRPLFWGLLDVEPHRRGAEPLGVRG